MMVRMRLMTVMMVVTVRTTESMTRTSEPCYYQPYYKQLTCSCHAESPSSVTRHVTFLNIKLGYYVRQLGQEVLKESTKSFMLETINISRQYFLNILQCKYLEGPSVVKSAILSQCQYSEAEVSPLMI